MTMPARERYVDYTLFFSDHVSDTFLRNLYSPVYEKFKSQDKADSTKIKFHCTCHFVAKRKVSALLHTFSKFIQNNCYSFIMLLCQYVI